MQIENLVKKLISEQKTAKKKELFKRIKKLAENNGIFLASTYEFYEQKHNFSVPAFNLRLLTFDLAKAIFQVAKKTKAGFFIFEIAKSEMVYSDQSPEEYAGIVLAAAISQGYSGPVFIQGDHFQVNCDAYLKNKKKEINNLKKLIQRAISTGFYNIDIDSSTLVDLSKKGLANQQKENFKVCAELTEYIRSIEPKDMTVSVGGEIGEIGTKNTTSDEFVAFMNGYNKEIKKQKVISKISIQSGTKHGGVVLPNGSLAKVNIDFPTTKKISKLAQKKYNLAGVVQHGASTLPKSLFNKFPKSSVCEVHLATEFQNMILDHKSFPKTLKKKMYSWIEKEYKNDINKFESKEQFFYKMRKNAFGKFKKEINNLPQPIKNKIIFDIEKEFIQIFKKLNVFNTQDLVKKYYS